MQLEQVVLMGFSAGGQIASNVGLAQNDDGEFAVDPGVKIAVVINVSGPVDGLDVVERTFVEHEAEMFREVGRALFPGHSGPTPHDVLAVYEPITYFDPADPPFFLWYGGQDRQILPSTFEDVVAFLENQ